VSDPVAVVVKEHRSEGWNGADAALEGQVHAQFRGPAWAVVRLVAGQPAAPLSHPSTNRQPRHGIFRFINARC
jgi:hypothetical protein